MLCIDMPDHRHINKFMMVTFPCIILLTIITGLVVQDLSELYSFESKDGRIPFYVSNLVKDISMLPVVLWVFRNTSK